MFGGCMSRVPGPSTRRSSGLRIEGLVRSEVSEGRRVYSLTEAGAGYLRERTERVERLLKSCSTDAEMPALLVSGKRLAQSVMLLIAEGDPEKMRQAAEILDEARRRIAELVTR